VPCSDGCGFVAFRHRVGTGLSRTMKVSLLVYHALDLMPQTAPRNDPRLPWPVAEACLLRLPTRAPRENEVSPTWASFPALGNPFRDAADLHAPTRSKTASGSQVWFRSVDSAMRPTQVAVRSRVSADAKSRFQSGGTSGSSA
jgi:hypothetical protein